MNPIDNRRIYTPLGRAIRKAHSINEPQEVSPTETSPTSANVEIQSYRVRQQERRSGRDRRKHNDSHFLDIRSGRDRRKSRRLDIKV